MNEGPVFFVNMLQGQTIRCRILPYLKAATFGGMYSGGKSDISFGKRSVCNGPEITGNEARMRSQLK
jgi:hypothetical protein